MQTKVLQLQFNLKAGLKEVSAFRGAFGHTVNACQQLSQQQRTLFHNHKSNQINQQYTPKDIRFAYPLIQYFCLKGNAHIIVIGQNASEALGIFVRNTQFPLHFQLNGKKSQLQLSDIKSYEHNWQVQKNTQTYLVSNWLALNSRNAAIYKKLITSSQKKELLKGIFINNCISIAKAIGWQVPTKIEVDILNIENGKPLKLKGIKMRALNVELKTNLLLPSNIGIGKSTSKGFGRVKNLSQNTI